MGIETKSWVEDMIPRPRNCAHAKREIAGHCDIQSNKYYGKCQIKKPRKKWEENLIPELFEVKGQLGNGEGAIAVGHCSMILSFVYGDWLRVQAPPGTDEMKLGNGCLTNQAYMKAYFLCPFHKPSVRICTLDTKVAFELSSSHSARYKQVLCFCILFAMFLCTSFLFNYCYLLRQFFFQSEVSVSHDHVHE